MTIFAEISFSEPVGDGTFTYHLPSGMQPPEIGCRALVPMHGRRLIGYVIALHEAQPAFKTLAVIEIIDPLPLFSPAMLQLAVETARDCVCNLGEVLHAMLPGGITVRALRVVSPFTGERSDCVAPCIDTYP